MKNISHLPWYIQMHGADQYSCAIKNSLGNIVGLFSDYRNAEACLQAVNDDNEEIKALEIERKILEEKLERAGVK